MKRPILHKKYDAKQIYGKDKNIMFILGVSVTLSIFLFFIGFLMLVGFFQMPANAISGMDFIVFGILTVIGPIGFYNHIKAKRKRDAEEHLPDFLREISSSASSGMTIFDAIISASNGDYGLLTPEIKMMAAQLSWGISVSEALENFAKRINTPSVKRIIVTINKSLEIGGNTTAVFEAAAKEVDQVKVVEEQRRAEMSLYAIVIFISFFVFLAVILIIDKTIFAEFFNLQKNLPSVQGAHGVIGASISSIDPELLKNTFFLFVLVQSIGGGLLGGYMMDGKLSSGVRFGFALVLVSFFVFKFLF
jgi:flagellar protein FlaJ